jgi:hypothetical protein
VQCWGEQAGASPIPGAFAVLVNGAYAGGFGAEHGSWTAVPAAAVLGADPATSSHATAAAAVAAILAARAARNLGARAGSPVTWTAKARRRCPVPAA